MNHHEILEHTADVGIKATGDTLEACFEQATRGLTAIIGIDRPGEGERLTIDVRADDLGALLVDWLSEILYLHDARDALIAGVEVDSVTNDRATGTVVLVPRGGSPVEGTQVKAITFHKLSVRETPEGFVAEVYLDV